jgi:hypothetical protein
MGGAVAFYFTFALLGASMATTEVSITIFILIFSNSKRMG